MLYRALIILLITSGCAVQQSNTSLYKAKGNKKNTPYDDNHNNSKELKVHQKKAKERRKELDHINQKDASPTHEKVK